MCRRVLELQFSLIAGVLPAAPVVLSGSALRGRYSGGGSTARGRFQAMPKLSGVGYSLAQVSGSGMAPGHLAGRALEVFHSRAMILATGGGLSFYSRSRQFSKQWRLAVGDQVPWVEPKRPPAGRRSGPVAPCPSLPTNP